MMAAFVRAALARLPERTRRCQENAERLRRGLVGLAGVHLPRVPDDRTSVHHKVRVHLDPARAGLGCSPRKFRDAMIKALAAEGLEVVLWQSEPMPAQPLFQSQGFHEGGDPQTPAKGFGRGFPWSSADPASARANYAQAFPNTRRLLDGSIVLFSQSCPLIAQDAAIVDKYVEAFAKVHAQRERLVEASVVGAGVAEGPSVRGP
jgi:dTDP-4-amino-4,6-dideoxygalactose transaminase